MPLFTPFLILQRNRVEGLSKGNTAIYYTRHAGYQKEAIEHDLLSYFCGGLRNHQAVMHRQSNHLMVDQAQKTVDQHPALDELHRQTESAVEQLPDGLMVPDDWFLDLPDGEVL